MQKHKKIYSVLVSLLEAHSLPRESLIDAAATRLCGTERSSCGIIGDYTALRGEIGSIVNEMEESSVIELRDGKYILIPTRSIALRAENCEREIIAELSERPLSKQSLRTRLEKFFGTDKTPSLKDDSTLHSLIGQVLKRLTRLGVIVLEGGKYALAPKSAARIDDISAIVTLKASFINRIHYKGGEFFEHYIMTLIGKFLAKQGKQIVENRTLGGSQDGGIDGIIKTVDALGFRETIMVQAKNRLEATNETTVRSFYGAVCAKQGSRGIFATTSDFHPGAKDFLDGIDNCVGINGDMIFYMAVQCQYGIKQKDKKYVLDIKNI